jgi:tetratricopeptide (TPR) repeat protein
MRIIAIAGWLLAGSSLAHAAAVATEVAPTASAPAAAAPDQDTVYVKDADDAANKVGLSTALDLIGKGQPQLAAAMLDKLIPRLDKRYAHPRQKVFCAYTSAESLYYMGLAGVARQDAVVVERTYCDAYFLRGYANVDLDKPEAAEADFTRALALSPVNPHYLSEMGELQSKKRDWTRALDFFERARDAATPYAPESLQVAELTRALRGIGYVDIELGKLDEAEAQYRRCLELDPGDTKAQGELGYVLDLKAKRP